MRADEQLGPTFVAYHDIVAAARGDEAAAALAFRKQLEGLADVGYRFASMSEFLDGAALDHKDLILTFDDGARSFVTAALPALRELGVSATLFVLTGFMGRKGDGVEFLDWDEIVELQAEGIEFGSHGVSHVPFDEIEPGRMREEIQRSAEELDAHGIRARTLAYPFGRFDHAAKEATRVAGFEAAFTVMKGGTDRYEIRRRLLTGLESPATARLVVSRHYLEVREGVRTLVPRGLLKQERPIDPSRWGLRAFGADQTRDPVDREP